MKKILGNIIFLEIFKNVPNMIVQYSRSIYIIPNMIIQDFWESHELLCVIYDVTTRR